MPSELNAIRAGRPMTDRDLFEASPFLASLTGWGRWRDVDPSHWPEELTFDDDERRPPSLQRFRRDLRRRVDDPEAALLALRRLRVRSLLALARADLENRIKPYQLRARLRSLNEILVQGAWWVAERSLRERYVHPLILERRNINPPMAIFSLSRLGSGEPWYTTGPAPIFVHSRAAEFAPALTEKDFMAARRSEKEWLPAREYFHKLARRTMSYLTVPDAAGTGFGHMAEDLSPDSALLPGALVVLFSAFEEHFLHRRPVRERLALLRLRFLVGQEKLGRAVEAAARDALLRTALELGGRLRSGINSWYRERSKAEGLPLVRGGLLDIERVVRLAQFRAAADDPSFLTPSPLKALELLAAARIIQADERLALVRSYSWQWHLINRMSLFGRRESLDPAGLKTDSLDNSLGVPGAAAKTRKLIEAARGVLNNLARETQKEAAS